MSAVKELLSPDIKGDPVFSAESGTNIVGCKEHPGSVIYDRYVAYGVIVWCLPPSERAHIIEGRYDNGGKMPKEVLLANVSNEPKHPE